MNESIDLMDIDTGDDSIWSGKRVPLDLIGQTLMVRSAGYYYIGKLVENLPSYLVLENVYGLTESVELGDLMHDADQVLDGLPTMPIWYINKFFAFDIILFRTFRSVLDQFLSGAGSDTSGGSLPPEMQK